MKTNQTVPNRTSMFSVLLTSAVFLATASICFSQPVITSQPAAQATAPGTTATFQVRATGTAPLAYQWQKNPGGGFADLADRTNAALVLTDVQPWDAGDYRVVITNITGARTSSVAHLYVMRPALVTSNVVLDNFDDNKLTGWISGGSGQLKLTETNQHLTLHGHWPGVRTVDITDTIAYGHLNRLWSAKEGQTLEWRVDLVGINEHAPAACIELWNSSASYVLFKGRDFIHICKPGWSAGGGHGHFVHEKVLIKNTNVVLSWSLTRVSPNVILTARVLDKENNNAVLYERSVVDTPNEDRTLTQSEMDAASGMHLNTGRDVAGAPVTSAIAAILVVWQYNYDGKQPAAEATFDNFELWTSIPPATRYVDVNSTNPTPPYTNWFTAATNIQDAVDVALAGDEIVVTNGTYATGGRAVGTNLLVNRVAVDKPLTVRSVNGPQVTIIRGYQVPGTTNGDGAIRCVYLTNGASLSGFTLINGATRAASAASGWPYEESSGGGVWCESTSASVSNCVVAGNSASDYGGGAYGGTLDNCTLTGNSANAQYGGGGGAHRGTLNNCTLTGNSAAWSGGGAFGCTLNNCTLTGNSAGSKGGGVYGGRLNNCIVYFNKAAQNPNYDGDSIATLVLNYCCTTPLPVPQYWREPGVGNISLDPQLASANHLSVISPCRGAGSAAFAAGSDIDGEPWANPPSIGCDEYHAGAVSGPLTVRLAAAYTNVAVGFPVDLTALIEGRATFSVWDFGDGITVSNQPYATRAWTASGNYLVALWAFNETHPEGVNATVTVRVVPQPVHYVAFDSP